MTALNAFATALQGFLDAAPDAIVIIDVAGAIVIVNRQVRTLFGYGSDDLLGQSVEMLLPDRSRAMHIGHRAVYSAQPHTRQMGAGRELTGRRKDGSEFAIEISLSPLTTPEGTLVISIIRDATLRQKAEAKFRGLLESAPDAMVVVDGGGRMVLVNGQSESIFGYCRDELIGKPIEMLLPERLHGVHRQHRVDYFKKPKTRGMGVDASLLIGRKRDGTEFPVEISLAPMQTDEGLLVTAAIRDVTERKRVENQLQAQTRELARSNTELEHFAYVASHDLRAPLRAIDNLASWLEQDLAAVLADEPKAYMRLLRSRVKRMDRLLVDLLEFSRVGRQAVTTERVDLAALVREVVELCDRPRDFEIRIGAMPVLETARLPLQKVFLNLIGNACKHHDRRSGVIAVTAEPEIDHWRFTVADDGPGIPPNLRAKAFEMFQTLQPRDTVEGSGMGLALVRKLVETMGGQVWIEPNAARGMTVRFTWPRTANDRFGEGA